VVTEEFDRRGALTPYFGFGRRNGNAAGLDGQTPEVQRYDAHRQGRDEYERKNHARVTREAGPGMQPTMMSPMSARGAVLEVLLWRDAARSAIHFTFGMTALFATRLAPAATVSGVSASAYVAMAYIVCKYVWAVMFPRLSYGLSVDAQWMGDVAERCAIGFNNWAARHNGVLAGRDNTAVFRVFVALYAISSLGRVMSAWAVATTLWVAAFTVPSIFEAYKYPLMKAYFAVYGFFSSRFNSLSAPKRWFGGLVVGAATFASVSARARFCLSFLALVALRMFREAHVKELEAFENIVRSARRRVSRSMNDFAMIVSPVVRHRRR
jgi:hypothetical protein